MFRLQNKVLKKTEHILRLQQLQLEGKSSSKRPDFLENSGECSCQSQRLNTENVGLLLKGKGDSVTVGRLDVPTAFFDPVSTNKVFQVSTGAVRGRKEI